MSKPSMRVYVVPHGQGDDRSYTGTLLRSFSFPWDDPAPSAFGATLQDVLAALERQLVRRVATGGLVLDHYLWTETFAMREVKVEVYPRSSVKKREVVGARRVPLRLSYAYSKLEGGGYRIMLPRFDGWFIVEELEQAPEVLRSAVSSWLLGQNPRTLYDFRWEGEESVLAWSPSVDARLGAPPVDDMSSMPALSQVAESLSAKASKGRLPPLVGEAPELAALLRHAAQSPPSSVLLVGAEGTGKTALVRRLARQLATRKGKAASPVRVFATSADRILSGMIYLGMWQKRCLEMLRELEGEGDYLFVDRLAGLLAPQPDGSSIAEMFEQALHARQISLIAECTPGELEHARRTHPSFVGAFEIVRVTEPSPTNAADLLVMYADKKRGPRVHPLAARRAVELLSSFVRGQCFPGKAMRFWDRVSQEVEERRGRKGAGEAAAVELSPRDVTEAFSRQTGIPYELLSDDVGTPIDELSARLEARVIGQPEACRAAARVLARFKAGLNDPDRPVGSLLLVGPTGVGKTLLARQLSRTMFGDESRLVRLDMSEYGAYGSADRLFDARPEARSLARRVAEQSLCVVLLDEIEKAHPDVFDVLLGVLGEGRLTDSNGRLVDMRGVVVMMTSNLGVSESAPVGFGGLAVPDFHRAVRAHFRPELFNRIDAVVSFKPLTPHDVRRIVDLELDDVRARRGLARRGVTLEVTAAARQLLAERGHHPTYGARPLRRLIEERVVAPVSAMLARDPSFRDTRVVLVAGEADGATVGEGAVVVPVG